MSANGVDFEWHEFNGLESQLPVRGSKVFVRSGNGSESDEAWGESTWAWGVGQTSGRSGCHIAGWRYDEDWVARMRQLEIENV
jgi:hypothetical protein